jgi:hypothetical protein
MNVPLDPRPEPPSWAPPPPPSDESTRGSLWLGFGLAWLVVIVGNIVAFTLVGASGGSESALALLALPWLAAIGLIVWLAAKGKPRTAVGVAIGLGTIVAIAVLLVAACFSLLANNFR